MKFFFQKFFLISSIFVTLFYLNSCKCCKNKKTANEELKKTADSCQIKCDMIPDPGSCKAYFPKYYFDKKEGKCKEFIWGGCYGTVPFQTLEECEKCGCEKK